MDNVVITTNELKALLDMQTRFFMARRYIEGCKKYSLDREFLCMIFEIEDKKGEE